MGCSGISFNKDDAGSSFGWSLGLGSLSTHQLLHNLVDFLRGSSKSSPSDSINFWFTESTRSSPCYRQKHQHRYHRFGCSLTIIYTYETLTLMVMHWNASFLIHNRLPKRDSTNYWAINWELSQILAVPNQGNVLSWSKLVKLSTLR